MIEEGSRWIRAAATWAVFLCSASHSHCVGDPVNQSRASQQGGTVQSETKAISEAMTDEAALNFAFSGKASLLLNCAYDLDFLRCAIRLVSACRYVLGWRKASEKREAVREGKQRRYRMIVHDLLDDVHSNCKTA